MIKITNRIDIVYIPRMKETLNDKIIKKIFTPNEIKYINSRNNNIDTICGLFAAKEAFLKSMHSGLEGYNLQEIEIAHDNYAPYFTFYGKTKKEIEENNYHYSLSISHEQDYAIAYVIKY